MARHLLAFRLASFLVLLSCWTLSACGPSADVGGSLDASSSDALSSSVLLVSADSQRAQPRVLAATTLSGKAYVFTDRSWDARIRRVDFYLDDASMRRTPNVEHYAPFDLQHTASDGTANPLDTTRLQDGAHSVTVSITFMSGKMSVTSASFSVQNKAILPPPPVPDAGTLPPPATDGGTVLKGRAYPLHTNIVATTFWVGEIFDPTSPNGSQVFSTYDSKWEVHYGGCDGDNTQGSCQTEARTAANGYFPLHMTPHENPFYLDLPFDDVNNANAFAERANVIPWANDPGYAGHGSDSSFSYMKNRWVKLMKNGHVCYAQNEDAGPAGASAAGYEDKNYVFGANDARPLNKLYHGAGMDVSPAVNGCLGFAELNGENDVVRWQFVDDVDVPPGPWKTVVTTSQVTP